MPQTKSKPVRPTTAVDRKLKLAESQQPTSAGWRRQLTEVADKVGTAVKDIQQLLADSAQQPIQPETPQPTPGETRKAEAKAQLEDLQGFAREFSDISWIDFDRLKTFKLILDRNHGCTTPIEEFIESLIDRYAWLDEDGKGMTLEDVEQEMEDLKNADLRGEIEQARFMADRYPRPEPKPAA